MKGRHNLAFCHYRSGDHESAGRLFADVLERSERVLGETNPDTLRYATSQSCFIREHGDIDQARELSETTIARYEVMLAEGHPFVAEPVSTTLSSCAVWASATMPMPWASRR